MSNLKIVIAEDDKVTRKLYSLGLPNDFCEKHFATNGKEALELYENIKPDIVILDISMPVLNGYQALKSIRNEYEDRQTTVVMVTGSAERDDIVACAKLEIQGYIIKPFKTKDIAKTVLGYHEAWVSKRQK